MISSVNQKIYMQKTKFIKNLFLTNLVIGMLSTFVLLIISKDTNAIFFHTKLVAFSNIYMEACRSVQQAFLYNINYIHSMYSEHNVLIERLVSLEKDNKVLQDEISKLIKEFKKTNQSSEDEICKLTMELYEKNNGGLFSNSFTSSNLRNVALALQIFLTACNIYNGIFPAENIVTTELCSKDRNLLESVVKDIATMEENNKSCTTEIVKILKQDPSLIKKNVKID